MGKDNELLQLVKVEDVAGLARLLHKYRANKPNALNHYIDATDDDSGDVLDEAIDSCIEILSRRYVGPRTKIIKSRDWWTKILPQYDDRLFRHHMRMARTEFDVVLQQIQNTHVFTNCKITVDLQLAVALARFGENGTSGSWLKTAAHYGIGEGMVNCATKRVIEALMQYKEKWIQWPDQQERMAICKEMNDKLPNCIGYLDGTHINLEEAPIDDPESYYSRNQRYGIQLQAVADNDKCIRNIVVGYPASVHDARVYVNTPLGQASHRFLTSPQWIAADSAYPLSEWIITPFRRNANIPDEDRVKFNKHFAKYRVNIEDTFGILKEVFGSLKELRIRVSRQSHQYACEWITACCILYNMIRPNPEDYDITLRAEANDDVGGDEHEFRDDDIGCLKRRGLLHWILGAQQPINND